MSASAYSFRRIAPGELPTQTVALARALLGLVIVRDLPEGQCAGRIVEVEAYIVNDPASHAFAGRTARNASMFLGPFHSYVYQIYGTAFCLNVTSETESVGAAVLVRALEPLAGIPLMQSRRGLSKVSDLCRGPGRLCKALNIDLGQDGLDVLNHRDLWLARGARSMERIGKSKRIGISKAGRRHLRFYEAGSPYLSGPRALSP